MARAPAPNARPNGSLTSEECAVSGADASHCPNSPAARMTTTCPPAVGHTDMQKAATTAIVARSRSGHRARAKSKRDQDNRRGQREPKPGTEPAEESRAKDADGDPDLAARRAGQELAE